ncbi:hypothetical protein D3C86_1346160 [compost metagenome]
MLACTQCISITMTPHTGRKPFSLPGSVPSRASTTPSQKNSSTPIANRLNTRFIAYLPYIELIADLTGLLVLELLLLSKLAGSGNRSFPLPPGIQTAVFSLVSRR